MTSLFVAIACSLSAPTYTTKSIDRGAYRIAYHQMGSGRPFVALAGGPGFSGRALWSFGYEMKEIAKTILFDQLGTGDSQFKDKTANLKPYLSIENTLKDLEALRKSLGYKKWSVFGQSWGAILAVKYAATYPESVDRLVIASVPGFGMLEQTPLGDNLKRIIPEKVQDELLQISLNTAIPEEEKTEKLTLGVLPYYFSNLNEGFALVKRAPGGMFNPKVFSFLYPSINRWQTYDGLAKNLEKWKGKALILQGHLDPAGSSMGYELKYRFLPEAKVKMIYGAGHFSWMERGQGDMFFMVLYDWLGKHLKPHWDADAFSNKEELAYKKRMAAGWPFCYIPPEG